MRYNSTIYMKMEKEDLLKLRSKKVVRLNTLLCRPSYLNDKEATLLEHQIKQIDAVLAWRATQLRMEI